MPSYPPADDRLKHLLAQEINLSVDTWKLAFWIADGIVKSPEIRAELDRIAAAHRQGQPCGDRHCKGCFDAQLATASVADGPAVETHVVADGSDDPEHVGDCPGCNVATAARPVEVVLPPTARLSYRLEHRSKGEITWRQGHPLTGLRWTYADRERADQRLVEMRALYPQYEYRVVTIATTVAETVEETH